MAGVLLLTAGCGAASPARQPSVADCDTNSCVTTTPAQATDPVLATPVATPDAVASPVGPASSSTPVAFHSVGATLGPVVWATAVDDETRAPRDQVTSFTADASTIYATVAVEQIAAGTTVQAQWSYNRTRLESLDQVIVAERADSGVWLEFHLSLSQGESWPTGTYELSLAVNGEPAVRSSVEVIAAGS